MKRYKTPFSVRGDSYYCPLAFSLDCYWNCEIDCHHCYFRRLNRTWGTELRPLDVEQACRKLHNGLANKNPKSALAHCLAGKKTIRVGNKTDPFQPAEAKYHCTLEMLRELCLLNWTFVIQTRCTDLMMEEAFRLLGNQKDLATVMPVISPGWVEDWEILERGRTTHPRQRLEHLRILSQEGINVGVNGEPFIPGYHTVAQFEEMMKLLKQYGIPSYNTYNFHFNDYVAKRLVGIGIDIEKIWYHNQDEQWKPILQQLMGLATKYGIRLGCPDFVNTGPDWKEKANTCCGVRVSRPTKFNTHWWKKLAQAGKSVEEIVDKTWDGIGDLEYGKAIIRGTADEFYTLKDAGITVKDSTNE